MTMRTNKEDIIKTMDMKGTKSNTMMTIKTIVIIIERMTSIEETIINKKTKDTIMIKEINIIMMIIIILIKVITKENPIITIIIIGIMMIKEIKGIIIIKRMMTTISIMMIISIKTIIIIIVKIKDLLK